MPSHFCKTTLITAALALATASWAQADPAIAAAAKEAGAVVTKTGLVYRSLTEGKGASPVPTDKVKVHYKGTFPDGKEFDSSYKRNEPTEFPLNRVIPCWTEGVGMMKVGGKAKLTCHPPLPTAQTVQAASLRPMQPCILRWNCWQSTANKNGTLKVVRGAPLSTVCVVASRTSLRADFFL